MICPRCCKLSLEQKQGELLEAKNKAEANSLLKTSFLADMSHEIRTPLNAIVGFSQVIASQCDTLSADERQKIIEIINKNIGNWQKATLYVEDPLEEEKIILGTGSVNKHGEEEKVVISLSLKDEKIIKNLYARRRQVFILYENNEQQKVCAIGGEHLIV